MKFPYVDLEAVDVNGLRFYDTKKGNCYPSITTVLGNTQPEDKKHSLQKWQTSLGKDAASKVTKDAADRGTAVHLLAERYLKKEPLVNAGEIFSPEQMNGFNAIKIKLNSIKEVWGQEVALYSNLIRVAGRCDCIGIYKNIPCIIDFKTSTRLKTAKDIEDYRLQLCAYSIMHNEMFDTNILNGIIIMSSSSGFPQEFKVNLVDYYDPLLKRVEHFYNTHPV